MQFYICGIVEFGDLHSTHLINIYWASSKKKERNSRTIDTTITLLSQGIVLTVAQRAEERTNWILNGLEDSIQNTVLRREGKRQKVTTERRLIRKEGRGWRGHSSIWRVNNWEFSKINERY